MQEGSPNTLIQLFARPPLEGKVKTRLIPDVGAKSATAIYRHCLLNNLSLVKDSPLDYQIWLTEPSSNPLFEDQPVRYQQGENLGKRMLHSLRAAFNDGYQKALLIGSDCIEITQPLLQRVSDKLDTHALVFIPAMDGGYVLIAARRTIHAELFNDIDWSTERVLRQTLEKAMQSGIATALLNPLRDIDTADDLQHYPELTHYL